MTYRYNKKPIRETNRWLIIIFLLSVMSASYMLMFNLNVVVAGSYK